MGRPRFVIVYSTKEGQTEKIARRMASSMDEMGVDADVFEVEDVPDDWRPYRGAVLGGSIHMGSFDKKLVKLAQKRIEDLFDRRASFFAVCLSAMDRTQEMDEQVETYLKKFRETTGWSPAMMTAFAGAIPYTKMGFIKKFVIQKIAEADGNLGTDTSQDYEYTDWKSVEAFTEDVVAHVVGREVADKENAPPPV